MCGIAGIISFKKKVEVKNLKDMLHVIRHRGPDGSGIWLNSDSQVGLGHVRLAIIDLSVDGAQPMHFWNNRYTITYNGEIYNYIELRAQLLKVGYSFRTETDTEVLLALFHEYGPAGLNFIDGMFSFAIWDELKKQLFCARDRFGEKPFYYHVNNEHFVFASEIKQFWKIDIQNEIDEKKVDLFVSEGIIENESRIDETFYKNIYSLNASHWLVVDGNGKICQKRYWEIDLNKAQFSYSFEEAQYTFNKLFVESIARRLRSDVSVGSSLSGGLDSSSIVTQINRMWTGKKEQHTFSARFSNYHKDEGREISKIVSSCDNLVSHETWPDGDYLYNQLDEICYHQDEPFGSASIVAQFSVMSLAKKKGITVLLDGQGADEYLAGYLRYYKLYLDQLSFTNRQLYQTEKEEFFKLHGKSAYEPYRSRETVRMKLGRLKHTYFRNKLFMPSLTLKEMLKLDTESKELRTLLRYADRNSMAHSLEVRTPFLSFELVEFVFSLPEEYLLKNGWTKYLLRKSQSVILPSEIAWKSDKIGYEPPEKRWLASGLMKDEVEKAYKILGRKRITSSHNDTDWRVLIASKFIGK